MKNLIYLLILLFLLSSYYSCASQNTLEGPVLVEGKKLPDFTFKDQFNNTHTIDAGIEKIIFAFDEYPAHAVNDYLADKSGSFLKDNKTLFIADISAAPSLIRKMFILPGIKKYAYPVLIFTDKEEARPFRHKIETKKIVVAHLKGKEIVLIETLMPSIEEVKKIFNDETSMPSR
jgi:hypothetical protein